MRFFLMPFLRSAAVPLVSCCAFFLFAGPAHGAGSDVEDLAAYTLTKDKVHSLAQALSDIGDYTKAHPEVRASLETQGNGDESLDAAAARMASVPQIRAILDKDRLPAREFLLVQLTFVQSAMAVVSKPIDQGDYEYAAKLHLNPANLSFMRNHRSELQAMQARLGTAS